FAGGCARARLRPTPSMAGRRRTPLATHAGCSSLRYHWLVGRTLAFFRRGPAYGAPLSRRSPNMRTLEVKVWRGGADGRFQTFPVPRRDAQTVLDVVTYIQRRLDPTLAYRFACRVGMCGSCAMMVNGKAIWTCRAHVAKVAQGDTLQIAPLAHLPIVRDLVTDMREFFDKSARAKGQFTPTTTRRDDFARVPPNSPARQAIDATIECIGCGVC